MAEYKDHTDKELFALIAKGDHSAYKALLIRHRNNLFGQAMAFLKDTFKAQDVVQEVFLTIWDNRETLANVANPENYLFIIARNKLISDFRKKVPFSVLDTIEHTQRTFELTPDIQLENKQIRNTIQLAVNQMPPQRKIIFELSKNEGMKYEDIARRLNISPNTVKVHMVQALSSIRTFIRNNATLFFFFL